MLFVASRAHDEQVVLQGLQVFGGAHGDVDDRYHGWHYRGLRVEVRTTACCSSGCCVSFIIRSAGLPLFMGTRCSIACGQSLTFIDIRRVCKVSPSSSTPLFKAVYGTYFEVHISVIGQIRMLKSSVKGFLEVIYA